MHIYVYIYIGYFKEDGGHLKKDGGHLKIDTRHLDMHA